MYRQDLSSANMNFSKWHCPAEQIDVADESFGLWLAELPVDDDDDDHGGVGCLLHHRSG